MNRGRSYYRRQRVRAIKRKTGLLRRIGGEELALAWSRGEPGRLAKGKIHCSCPICRRKSCDEASRRDKAAAEDAAQQLRERRQDRSDEPPIHSED